MTTQEHVNRARIEELRSAQFEKYTNALKNWCDAAQEFTLHKRGFLKFAEATISAAHEATSSLISSDRVPQRLSEQMIVLESVLTAARTAEHRLNGNHPASRGTTAKSYVGKSNTDDVGTAIIEDILLSHVGLQFYNNFRDVLRVVASQVLNHALEQLDYAATANIYASNFEKTINKMRRDRGLSHPRRG